MSEIKRPLEGVKVVELATFIAGPCCARYLADLGAEVIKVEAPAGDPLRYTAVNEGRPFGDAEDTSYALENTGKKCVTLNTKTEKGREALEKLIADCDIFITNWRQSPLKRAGLDYETLKVKYPKLVMGYVSGYGEKGPDKDLPGFDFTAFFARGGYFETLRQRSDVPFNGAPGVGDHNVGMNLVAGILAALYQAKTKGVGEKVETSLFESAVYNMGMMVQASNYEGIAQQYPINIRNGANPFNSAWHTADDRYIQTCMPDYNTYYKKFIAAVGREDLVENENYFPILTCQEKGLTTEVYDIVMEAFEKKTAAEWREILTAADIPFALCQNWIEIRNDKQAEANHCFYDMTYSNGNTRRLVRTPVKFENMGVPDYRRGPLIGEQGVDVLKEIGYNDEQIDALKANGTLYIWEDPKKA